MQGIGVWYRASEAIGRKSISVENARLFRSDGAIQTIGGNDDI